MRKIYLYTIALVASVLSISCNDEWKDEQYEQYVSFKAPIGGNGVTDIYVRYNAGGKVTYKLPVIISGSVSNSSSREVHVGVDPDTLGILNVARFGRKDLYYLPMKEEWYEFDKTVDVPAGTSVTTMDVNFMLGNIDMSEKWVLPLTVTKEPASNYVANPRKHYAKALLRVLPYNDFSGNYSTTTMQAFITGSSDPLVVNNRTAYVAGENSVFFYAGVMEETLINRRDYKIYFDFVKLTETSGNVTMRTDNPKIKLVPTSPEGVGYTISNVMDALRPYLMNRYLTFNVDYKFIDYTSAPGVEIPYEVKGAITLERNINTQIPDEDQAFEWQ